MPSGRLSAATVSWAYKIEKDPVDSDSPLAVLLLLIYVSLPRFYVASFCFNLILFQGFGFLCHVMD